MRKAFVLIVFLLSFSLGGALIPQSCSEPTSDLYLGKIKNPETSSAVLLDVPFVRQKKMYCSEASTTMVLRYYGYNEITQDYVNENIAINFENMLPRLKNYLDCSYATLSLKGLEKEINEGDPIMIRLQLKGYYHTVVVVGYGENFLLIHDPARGKYLKANPEVLQRYWKLTGHSAIIVTS